MEESICGLSIICCMSDCIPGLCSIPVRPAGPPPRPRPPGMVVEEDEVEEEDKLVERAGARRLLMQQEVVDLPRGENI